MTVERIIHKRGRRTFGEIVRLEDGRTVYIARRRLKDIFRDGRSSINKANDEGVACWTFDIDTLTFARRHHAVAVGVRVRETDDLYLTPIETYTNPALGRIMKSVAGRRHVPLAYFASRRGEIKL